MLLSHIWYDFGDSNYTINIIHHLFREDLWYPRCHFLFLMRISWLMLGFSRIFVVVDWILKSHDLQCSAVEVNSDGFLLFLLSAIRILLPFYLLFDQIAGVVVSQEFLDSDLVHSWTASCRFSEELLQYLQGKISISREGTIIELPVPSACVDHLATGCFVSPHLFI